MSPDFSKNTRWPVAVKVMKKAEDLGMDEREALSQIKAFGALQEAMELLDPERIDELVELVVHWGELTGANNVDGALSKEEIRENMEQAAGIQDDFNLPIQHSRKGDA